MCTQPLEPAIYSTTPRTVIRTLVKPPAQNVWTVRGLDLPDPPCGWVWVVTGIRCLFFANANDATPQSALVSGADPSGGRTVEWSRYWVNGTQTNLAPVFDSVWIPQAKRADGGPKLWIKASFGTLAVAPVLEYSASLHAIGEHSG